MSGRAAYGAPRTAWVALAAGVSLSACTAASEAPAWHAQRSPGLADEPVRDVDAPPFAPRPDSARRGVAKAVRIDADRVQARQTALAFARALLDTDAQALSLLLDEQVTLIAEGARKVRREVVTTCFGERPSLGYRQDRRLESVVDTAQLAVVLAGTEGVPAPSGVRGSDLLVQLPQALGASSGGPRIPCLGTIYVRPGARPVIVAVMR